MPKREPKYLNVRLFVERMGSTKMAAQVLGRAVTTVRAWNWPPELGGRDGKLGDLDREGMMLNARAHGVQLTDRDFTLVPNPKYRKEKES